GGFSGGGAIDSGGPALVRITESDFIRNSANAGSGASAGLTQPGGGGGTGLGGAILCGTTDFVITDSHFNNNVANGGAAGAGLSPGLGGLGSGGAIYIDGIMSITGGSFSQNAA